MGIVTWASAGRLRVSNPVTVLLLFTDLDHFQVKICLPHPTDQLKLERSASSLLSQVKSEFFSINTKFLPQAQPHTLSAPTTRGGSGVPPPLRRMGLTRATATVMLPNVEEVVNDMSIS